MSIEALARVASGTDRRKVIDDFSVMEHRWLSNFYASPVEYEGRIYPTAEHAFQAAKSTNDFDREMIRSLITPGKAKRAGLKVKLRSDWESVKVEIMTELLRLKFQDPILKRKLLETGNAELIEGNNWGDVYWGTCKGQGKNMLGKLLMKVREEIVDVSN